MKYVEKAWYKQALKSNYNLQQGRSFTVRYEQRYIFFSVGNYDTIMQPDVFTVCSFLLAIKILNLLLFSEL